MPKILTKKSTKTSKKKMTKTLKKCSSCKDSPADLHISGFPNHVKEKSRLNRVKGQIDGIDRMIDEGRYCLDIIFQIRAAASALKGLEKEIMYTHIKSCVKKAIESNDVNESQEKIQEVMNFF